jgi:hypothetical protein
VPAPATQAALDQATKLVLAPAVAAAEVAGPVLVLATLLVLAPAINPAEMVVTKSRFGGA